MACLTAERAAIRDLEANCHAPVGVLAQIDADSLQIRGFAGLPDGSKWVVDEIASEGGADAAGRELARRMKLAGAGDVLREAEAMVA
jgi:hydroxymethylbilane synthase